MLIEDNPGDIGLVDEALLDSGISFNLKALTNGREALEYLKKKNGKGFIEPPDLIILDLNLPLMKGLDVLREIKSDEKLEPIPVVILTTSETEEDIFNSYVRARWGISFFSYSPGQPLILHRIFIYSFYKGLKIRVQASVHL